MKKSNKIPSKIILTLAVALAVILFNYNSVNAETTNLDNETNTNNVQNQNSQENKNNSSNDQTEQTNEEENKKNESTKSTIRSLGVQAVPDTTNSETTENEGSDETTEDEYTTEALLLVDTENDEVEYSKNEDEVLPMADTAKIMTYIVASEEIDDVENTNITIEQEAIDDTPIGSTKAGFQNHVGEEYSALDLLRGLMIPNGNDAAQILANYVANGNVEEFVKKMNDKANEIGCTNTYFVDVNGISSRNVTTASDLYKITKYAIELPYFTEIVNTESYLLPGFTNPILNNNVLINQYVTDSNNGGEYYYKYAEGIKTGYSSDAGQCVVSIAKKGDKEYICIALGGELNYEDGYKYHAVEDTIDLYTKAFEENTENIDVKVDTKYKSVNVGEDAQVKISVENNTDQLTKVTWTSSNPEIATVNEYGIVTGLAVGQTIIRAESQTGNFDECIVSVGFYNGIDVNHLNGDFSSGNKEDINWENVKNEYGMDFAIIRVGYSEQTNNGLVITDDTKFENNLKGATENNIKVGLSYVSEATTEELAEQEAEYVLNKISENSEYTVDFPIIYNMISGTFERLTIEQNTEIAIAFNKKMAEAGYKTIVYADKYVFALMDIKKLQEEGIGLYYSYRPYYTDFSDLAKINGETMPSMWLYRGDAYIVGATGRQGNKVATYQVVAYMNDIDLQIEQDFVSYEILNGEDQTYTEGEDIKIRANGELSKFSGLRIDGVEISEENYVYESGSTIVTLKDSFLNTLENGDHEVTFVYVDGEVSTNLKIAKTETEKIKTNNPKTGDNIILYISIFVISVITMAVIVKSKRK